MVDERQQTICCGSSLYIGVIKSKDHEYQLFIAIRALMERSWNISCSSFSKSNIFRKFRKLKAKDIRTAGAHQVALKLPGQLLKTFQSFLKLCLRFHSGKLEFAFVFSQILLFRTRNARSLRVNSQKPVQWRLGKGFEPVRTSQPPPARFQTEFWKFLGFRIFS